jgi:hypothetical protein
MNEKFEELFGAPTGFFVDGDGNYVTECEVIVGESYGLYRVHVAPQDARQVWSFEQRKWSAPPRYVPQSVPIRKAKLALHRAGLLTQVPVVIASLPDNERIEAQIEWDTVNDLERSHPLVIGLGAMLGLNDTEIDDLFIAADAIV